MNKVKNLKSEEVLKTVQKFLKNPPVIIWGSGATIPYGLPSMNDLKQCLKSELGELPEDANLEIELSKINDTNKLNEVKKIIRDEILKKDLECLKKIIEDRNYLKAIESMIKKFYEAHPRIINIITTNYDCMLEYALSQKYDFSDGFTGRVLSSFNLKTFQTKKEFINLIKVHGSLNWFFDTNKQVFYLPSENNFNHLSYAMILPAKEKKYQEASEEPYRTLIKKSDNIIDTASSFLVVGFGFNDEHLTPKIDAKIKEDTPIVIITKKATNSCKEKLKNADKYCLLEEHNNNETKATIKTKNDIKEKEVILQKKYWQLNHFMKDVL